MAPGIFLRALARATDHEIPGFTARVMNLGEFCQTYKILPNISTEQMQSCEHYLRSWWIVLFIIFTMLPWRMGKTEDVIVHQRNKILLDILCHSSASLIGGILYHIHLSYAVTLYHTDVQNVTNYKKTVHWMNKVSNGELFEELTYGVRDYGVVKQEPITVYLFIGMLLVIVSWYLIASRIMKMGNMCLSEFLTVGVGGAFFIASCFIKNAEICLVALSVILPPVDYSFDLLFGWAYP